MCPIHEFEYKHDNVLMCLGRKSTDFGLYEGAEELTHLGAPLEDNLDEVSP